MMKKKILRYLIVCSIVIVLVMLDLTAKSFFDGKNITVIKDFFYIESAHNYGAGLSILTGHTTLLTIISFLFLAVFVAFDVFNQRKSILYNASIILIYAGAIGNLIDRLMLSYVRDFLYVNLPLMDYCFNFADVFLTFGIVLLCIEILFKREQKKDGKINSWTKR